jgi:ribonuclease E
MPKRMLIDSSHPEETRVVVLDSNRVEEFDFEAASKRPLKGNIYLAKVTRVEPSLQAAFVEYGGNRQGFLAFSEIHPDYYQIPVADRLAILQAQTQRMMAEEDFDAVEIATVPAQSSPVIEDEHAEDHAEHHEHEHAHHEAEPHGHEHEANEHADDEAREHASSEPPLAHEQTPQHSLEVDVLAEIEPATSEPSESERHSDEEHSGASEESIESTSSFPSHEEGQSEAPREVSFVQAEATGAPAVYERRGPRQNDRHDRPRPPRRRQYKIQEVIKRRQIMLVQVVKEERGNKGASLTTFMSLAGRYCVLMPNTPRGGGISRKITNAADRKRLKSAAQSLELPEGMGLIIRTAGANRTKLEIKRDYEYLLRLWDTVRELTLKSNAPALVYEEGSLIKRAIRDLYSKDISEVIVDGDTGYRDAKDFMRMLMPSHAKNVKLYKEALPLFQRFQVESQLDAMFSPTVNLRSGGYIVINQTEALVSIDVNSGKATREHSIEETAYKTNLEAADEIARQLRLRDLAGLIVIDFIDMEDSKNDRNVEKRLHNAVRGDRARIQIGKISQFGLLEMSRQRLRAGVLAGSTVTCPHCNGQGIIRSTESAALRLLRALDEEGQRQPAANVTVKAPEDVTIYTLNQKRREIFRIEEAYDLAITFDPQANMMGGSFEIERTGVRIPSPRPKAVAVSVEAGFHEEVEEEAPETDVTIVEAPSEPAAQSGGACTGTRGPRQWRRTRPQAPPPPPWRTWT